MNHEIDFQIELERNKDGVIIRVLNISEGRFDEAYLLIDSLYRRGSILDKKISVESRIDALWISDSTGFRLSDIVSQTSHRIALSLLRSYPDGKTLNGILRETELPKRSVYNYLTGRKASVKKYFGKNKEGYNLTSDGLDWILNDVIPFLASQTDLIESN